MKKRLFALIVFLGFVVIFTGNKNVLVTDSYNEQKFVSIDTSSVKAAPMEEIGPLNGMRIVLDAGHGGLDGGAVGQQGTVEKDITLAVVFLLQDMLEEEGATVQLTRDKDVFLRLDDRTHIAGMNRAHLFLSLHADGFENSEAKGISSYYYDDQSEAIATSIQEYIFKEDFETDNRGVDFGNYQVLRDSYMPAVLVELGYITNSEDEVLLNTPAFQEEISSQIVKGIIHTTNEHKLMNEAYKDIIAHEGPLQEIRIR